MSFITITIFKITIVSKSKLTILNTLNAIKGIFKFLL